MANRKRMLTIGSIPASLLLLGAASWGIGRVLPEPSLPAPQVVHARPEPLTMPVPQGLLAHSTLMEVYLRPQCGIPLGKLRPVENGQFFVRIPLRTRFPQLLE